ncbi:MAG: hypothetical protein HKN41_06175, partial [Ilumatobacter sp.]|nr:hypothetical protein [Ilumatobacter sp.]
TGLTERSQVLLVIAEDGSDEPTTVAARVVTSGKGADTGGVQAMSVEVAVAEAPLVASADDIRLVLLDPGVDPVTEAGG